MIKTLMDALDYGVFAELSLAIFVVVFVAIVVRTLKTQSTTTAEQARIVLGASNNNQPLTHERKMESTT